MADLGTWGGRTKRDGPKAVLPLSVRVKPTPLDRRTELEFVQSVRLSARG